MDQILQYARIMKLDGGEGSGVLGHTTEKHTVIVSGNTYAVKDQLKQAGFRFNAVDKTWEKRDVEHSTGLSRAAIEALPKGSAERAAMVAELKRVTGGATFADTAVHTRLTGTSNTPRMLFGGSQYLKQEAEKTAYYKERSAARGRTEYAKEVAENQKAYEKVFGKY